MTIGRGEFSKIALLIPNSNALLLIPSLSTIKLHNSSEGGLIGLLELIIIWINYCNPFVIIFNIEFLTILEFFNMKKTKVLGKKKILILDLEYRTKLSVKKDIDKTSINLQIE